MTSTFRLTTRAVAAMAVLFAVAGCTCMRSGGHRCGPTREGAVKRYGMVIGLKPDKVEEYKRLHAAVWPDVLDMIHKCNIRNYSIYLMKVDDSRYYLFSYFEYVGKDFKADMDKMAADRTTQEWWKLCKPCQDPLPIRGEGEWWATLEEVFHCK